MNPAMFFCFQNGIQTRNTFTSLGFFAIAKQIGFINLCYYFKCISFNKYFFEREILDSDTRTDLLTFHPTIIYCRTNGSLWKGGPGLLNNGGFIMSIELLIAKSQPSYVIFFIEFTRFDSEKIPVLKRYQLVRQTLIQDKTYSFVSAYVLLQPPVKLNCNLKSQGKILSV